MRSLRRLLALAGAVLVVLVVLAGPASAHSVLLSTSPAIGGSVTAAPESVALAFNEQPRGEYSTIHVTGPDGKRRDTGPVSVLNDVVSQQLAGSRPQGRYVVDWRVISADGHPVSGEFAFTATAAAAQLQPLILTGAPTTAESSKSDTGAVVIIVIGAVIVVAIVGWLTLRRRRAPVHE